MDKPKPRDLPPQDDRDDWIVRWIRQLGAESRIRWKGHTAFFWLLLAVLAVTLFSIAAAWLISLFH